MMTDKRDQRRWTLYKPTLEPWEVAPCAPKYLKGGHTVEVMPVSEHEAEMARRSCVDHQTAEADHSEYEALRDSAQTAARALDGPTSELIDAVYDLRTILNGPDPEASLRDAARLVVDSEYRRARLGPDTPATFDRALGELLKAWERSG